MHIVLPFILGVLINIVTRDLVDFSMCVQLKYVRVCVPITTLRDASIWDNLKWRLIHPLDQGNRTNPIEKIEICFQLNPHRCTTDGTDEESEEDGHVQFQLGAEQFYYACERAKKTGAVRIILLKSELDQSARPSARGADKERMVDRRFDELLRLGHKA